MAAMPSYNLRSRLQRQSLSLQASPTCSPTTKFPNNGLRRPQSENPHLEIEQIIGATINNPSGLSACASTNSFAYCAGSVVILTKVLNDASVTKRYFRARPTATSINPATSHYDSPSLPATPTKRRCSTFLGLGSHSDQGTVGIGRDFVEDSLQTWSARERIKATSCASLSFDGKLLAVGEAGYNPRVLIYSTEDSASTDTPLSILCDHSFGVQSVAFSKDSRYLASLGELNDGFIFVWQISQSTGKARLHSTNKCTTNVCEMAWCGNYLITAGTRHVKIWQIVERRVTVSPRKPRLRSTTEQVASPGPSPLQGRNCLLGDLVDATFTSVTAAGPSLVYVGTDKGHLCSVDLNCATYELIIVTKFDAAVTSLSFKESTYDLVIGTLNSVRTLKLNSMFTSMSTSSLTLVDTKSPDAARPEEGEKKNKGAIALRCLIDHTVVFSDGGDLSLWAARPQDPHTPARMLTHQNEALGGIAELPSCRAHGSFLTWTASGIVRFWNRSGGLLRERNVQLANPFPHEAENVNELKSLKIASTLDCIYMGDRYGVLKVVDIEQWREISECRAHSTEVTSIAVSSADSLIATCSRDRTVQLFLTSSRGLDHVQTMTEHTAAVTDMVFAHSGDKLISCSSDRTVVVRSRTMLRESNLPAYYADRVLAVKATPLSLALKAVASESIMLSTMDRCVLTIDITSGAVIDVFKVNNPENDDTVPLNRIQVLPTNAIGVRSSLLVGYSITDKSIRLYDYEKGILLSRVSGHTEGINDLAILKNDLDSSTPSLMGTIASVGVDGTTFLWSARLPPKNIPMVSPTLAQNPGFAIPGIDEQSVKLSPASLPPLRRVLSKLDMNGLLAPDRGSSPARDMSPPRLLRKSSRFAMSTTIAEAGEDEHRVLANRPEITRASSRDSVRIDQRSPSPFSDSDQNFTRNMIKSRSKSPERSVRRSPSPSARQSAPSTPQHRKQSHGGRLKRQPSSSMHLRPAAFHTTGSSDEAKQDRDTLPRNSKLACHTLQALRNEMLLDVSNQDLDLLEIELEATLALVKARQRTVKQQSQHGQQQQVDEIEKLLNSTTLNDPP